MPLTTAPRRALVTGGLSGIGQAVVAQLRTDGLDDLTADLHAPDDLCLDISSEDDLVRVQDQLDSIDMLVNSAGIVGPNMPSLDIDLHAWRRTLEVNLTGCFLMCRAVIGGMRTRGWGRTINAASVAGKEGTRTWPRTRHRGRRYWTDQVNRQRTRDWSVLGSVESGFVGFSCHGEDAVAFGVS